MRRIFSMLFLTTFATSCQKSNNSQTASAAVKPVKSAVVTYPLAGSPVAFFQSQFLFTADSVNDRLVVDQTDSIKYTATYDLFKSLKVFYYSGDLPRRVIRITYRRYKNNSFNEPDYLDYGNYDLDFVYADYTSHPNQIRFAMYRDYDATILMDKYTGVVQRESVYFSENVQDPVTLVSSLVIRKGNRTESWGGTSRVNYGDTSDEVTTGDNYYASVFFNVPAAFPAYPSNGTEYRSRSVFRFNQDQTCKIFAIDFVAASATNILGQRKFDFTYNADSKDLNGVVPLYQPADITFWDNIAARKAGIGYANFPGTYYGGYSYFPDLYSSYQDFSASYTDSLFTVTGGTALKTMINASSWKNSITRDSEGQISTITKSNQSDSVYRKIELFY